MYNRGKVWRSNPYTLKELWFALFEKKICPSCDNIMHPFITDWIKTDEWDGSSFPGHKEIYTRYKCYHCDSCNMDYSIPELVGEERPAFIDMDIKQTNQELMAKSYRFHKWSILTIVFVFFPLFYVSLRMESLILALIVGALYVTSMILGLLRINYNFKREHVVDMVDQELN